LTDNEPVPQAPTLTTDRLVLRPFARTDAPLVQRLAGEREVALNTEHIPHPYPDGAAVAWIETHQEKFDAAGEIVFAIDLRGDGLIGAIGIIPNRAHDRAEIGYWIGKPFWNKGYASEAAAAVIRFGFEELKLNKIVAVHFSRNPASGRVMQKNGMRHEGTLRQNHKKWGQYVDVEAYGILREEWERGRTGGPDKAAP
jgi:[ribosomal protein S5]-alanine N-acetyltransferase